MEPILESFELQNVVHFEKVQVDITPGLTVVLGHNKDSRISKEQNNGSGKSSLFGSIPNAMLGAAPLAISRSAKKEMLNRKDSRIILRWKHCTVEQNSRGWRIFDENGSDMHVRGQKGQLEKIRELIPIGEDEFYAYTYVQSQRDSLFQVGKPDARLGFITRMYGLDNYELLRKWFVKRLGDIKESEIRYSEIESNYLNLMQREQEIAWSEANDDEYSKLEKRVRKTRAKLQETERAIGELSATLDGVERSERARKRYNELAQTIEDPEATETYAREQLKQGKKYSTFKRELKSYKERHARVTSKIEELGETRSIKKLRKLHTQLTAKLKKLEEDKRISDERVEQRTRLVTQIKDRKKLRATYPEKLKPLKKIKNELAICSTTLSLKKLLHCEDNTCPTCKQDIDLESLRDGIEKASKRSTLLLEHERGHDVQNIIDRLEDELLKIPKVEIPELFYHSQIEDTKAKLSEVIQEGKRAANLNIYREELAALEKPKAVEKPEIDEKTADKLLHDAREMSKLKEVIGKHHGNPKKLRKQLAEHQAEQKKLDKRFSDAHDRWSELKVMRAELDVLTRERESAYEQLAELQPIIERKNLIKTLEKAYGKKGLKIIAANSILGMLERNLNEDRNLIFAEPFQFKVYADDKGVHCIVHRKDASPSDVRHLSGAESDSFRLLFMLATFKTMPAHKRPNFVVLDEPDSHMDSATTDLFLNTYLPYLRSLVPSVVIITPLDTPYDADRVIRVVKEKGIARIEER